MSFAEDLPVLPAASFAVTFSVAPSFLPFDLASAMRVVRESLTL